MTFPRSNVRGAASPGPVDSTSVVSMVAASAPKDLSWAHDSQVSLPAALRNVKPRICLFTGSTTTSSICPTVVADEMSSTGCFFSSLTFMTAPPHRGPEPVDRLGEAGEIGSDVIDGGDRHHQRLTRHRPGIRQRDVRPPPVASGRLAGRLDLVTDHRPDSGVDDDIGHRANIDTRIGHDPVAQDIAPRRFAPRAHD